MKYWSLLFFLLLSFTLPDKDDWKLKKEKNGVQVYTRSSKSSKIKELKVVTHLDVKMHALLAALDDVPSHVDWVFRCSSSKQLELSTTNGYYYYVTIDFPFPAIDRDLVVFTRKEQDEDTGVVKTFSVATPDAFPPQEGFIRIRNFNSTYILTPDENGGIILSYEMFTDPGGSIPAWMVNLAISKGPVKTMENLELQAQKPEYKGKKVAGIH